MQQLLTVTYGYLKYTLVCMAAGTTLFFLSALAMTSPLVFSIVLVGGIGAFFVVRMEIRTKQYYRSISKKRDEPLDPKVIQQSLIDWLTVAEAANMAFASVDSERIGVDATSLWISEWNHTYDPKAIPLEAWRDKAILEKAEMSLALKDLQPIQHELASHGLYIFSISKRPAEQIAQSISKASPSHIWTPIMGPHHGNKGEHPISIVFLHHKDNTSRKQEAEKLLQGSFRMLREGIDLKPRSVG